MKINPNKNPFTKKHKIIVFCTVIVALSLVYFSNFSIYGNKKGEIKIGDNSFGTEIVSAGFKREKGLAGRRGLCMECSMLFAFPAADRWGFWMKGMEFNLDIIWIRGNRVVWIDRKVSKDSKDILYPEEPSDKVLEINSGLSDEKGIRIGDPIEVN